MCGSRSYPGRATSTRPGLALPELPIVFIGEAECERDCGGPEPDAFPSRHGERPRGDFVRADKDGNGYRSYGSVENFATMHGRLSLPGASRAATRRGS